MGVRGKRGSVPAVRMLDAEVEFLWLSALLFFGIGDLLTTGIGWQLERVIEAGPVAAAALDRFGLAAMVVLKLLAFGCCYRLWRLTMRPLSAGIPFALSTLGVLVTAWNLAVISAAVL